MPAFAAFPACCGASVITGFNNDPDSVAGYKLDETGMAYAKDEKGENIPLTLYDQFKNQLEAYTKKGGGTMICSILTQAQINQYPKWLPLLKEAGFECVRRWTNAVHSDTQFLYLFVRCYDPKGKCKDDFTQPPKGWDTDQPASKAGWFSKAA